MPRVWILIIHFPKYYNGRILSYRDGSLQLVSEDDANGKQSSGSPDATYHCWATHSDGKGAWALTNLAAPDVRVSVDLSSGMIGWTGKPQNVPPCPEGLGISSGERDNLRLCVSAASVAGSCPSLFLELRNDTGLSFAALFECAMCQRKESSAHSSIPCRCSSIDSVIGTPFDYVIIGTSFCAYAFVHQAVANNPNVRILLLEKGDLFLLEHRQHPSTHSQLPTAESLKSLESRPCSFSAATSSSLITALKGQMIFFGGRSTFWSGWCPEPSDEDLDDGWPVEVRHSLRQYLGAARKLLNVTPANKIESLHNDRLIYGHEFQEFLETRSRGIQTLQISPGPIAMANDGARKISTPTPLIRMGSNVRTIVNCSVEKIIHDGKKATHLQTSLGVLPLHNAKLILAMSTLPSTTLVLNSFGKGEFPFLANVGKRLTAHFVSSAVARVPRNRLPVPSTGQGIQLGAVYIAGKAQAQYHLQMSAVATSNPESRDLELCRQFSANSIFEGCIKASPEHVLVSCSALGELDHKNKDNWFRLKEGTQSDLTCNGELQIVPNDQDLTLWDTMDDVMFKTIESCLSSSPGDKVEYLHDENKGVWKTERPTKESIRKKNAVHDASTMWMGGDGDEEAPVGLDYRLRGVENVFITGGALWPTGGSWNPVLTIVAMAMHLADSLNEGKI